MRSNHSPIACLVVVAWLCYVSTARGQVNCCVYLNGFPEKECFQVENADACDFELYSRVVDSCDECFVNCCHPFGGCFRIDPDCPCDSYERSFDVGSCDECYPCSADSIDSQFHFHGLGTFTTTALYVGPMRVTATVGGVPGLVGVSNIGIGVVGDFDDRIDGTAEELHIDFNGCVEQLRLRAGTLYPLAIMGIRDDHSLEAFGLNRESLGVVTVADESDVSGAFGGALISAITIGPSPSGGAYWPSDINFCYIADCAVVPAVSEWGLLVLMLIGLVAGTLLFTRKTRKPLFS